MNWPRCPDCNSRDVWMAHREDIWQLHCHVCGKRGDPTSWDKAAWGHGVLYQRLKLGWSMERALKS